MIIVQPQSFVEVKLLSNGRYVWKITVNYEKDYKEAIEEIKALDSRLKEEFPNHAVKAWGRTVELDE